MSSSDDAARLHDLQELILAFAGGDYSARLTPSDRGDSIDAVAVGLNLLGESIELERSRRKQAEAQLRDEILAYEQAPAMFCSVTTDGLLISKCNTTLSTTLGRRKADLLERRFVALLPRDERAEAEEALRAIASGQPPTRTTFHLEVEDRRIPILLSGSPAGERGERLLLILRDMSKERLLEAQLRQAQKLEAVGRLASGVAHDFNNILSVVLGSASLLRKNLAPGDKGEQELSAIVDAANNGSGLTRQLLALSKPIPKSKASSADLNQLIRDAGPLLRRSLGPANELIFELFDEPLTVAIAPSELVQVLMNLSVNARDAMPSGGRLRIRSSRSSDSAAALPILLEVADSGEGMEEDTLERVLDPFFTTKEHSGGSGLGLSVCHGIVNAWHGELEIHSALGEGTTVRIALPEAAVEKPRPTPTAAEPSPKKRILAVDDDPLVRSMLAAVLESDGYEVVCADGLKMAVELASGLDVLDLLISDVVMPGGSGAQVVDALWKMRPNLPVILVSGYTGNEISADLLTHESVRFLGKPFQPVELLKLVAELCKG